MTAIHVLLLIAVVEVVINRILVPMSRPGCECEAEQALGLVPGVAGTTAHTHGDDPWFVGGALFAFYLVNTLAILVILARCVSALRANRELRDVIAHVALGVVALIATVPLLVIVPSAMNLALEIGFGVALLALLASVFGRGRDLGLQVGLPILAVPLLFHTATVMTATLAFPEDSFNPQFNDLGAPGAVFSKIGVLALALAALTTPYCFAPRPFARAVIRPIPVVIAMSLAALGAVATRLWYPQLADATKLAIGVVLARDADSHQALYLLAIATLAWTLSASAFARSEARRTVGAGLALILLGGYAFHRPHHFLLPLIGVALIADAARRVRDEELEAMPFVAEAPPIADPVWSSYVGVIANGLRTTLNNVHSLTMRGDGKLASSIIVGDFVPGATGEAGGPRPRGIPVRTRIERIHGCVLALDVVIGREIDEVRGSTVTVWAVPQRGSGSNPAGPPATPAFRVGDAAFDARFRVRGNAAAFATLFDDDARARAITTLDGWLAYWERDGVRYRVYPGRGAPLDHPLPLSDLALGRVPANAERLVAVIELLVKLGTRVLEAPADPAEPSQLDVSGERPEPR